MAHIELERVYILSRIHATSFRCAQPWGCISIATESADFAEINESNRVGLLQIAFADLEQEPSQLTVAIYPELKDALFNESSADRILDFVHKIAGRISVLMVHCAMGQSRSTAVTASLLGINPRLLHGASPNPLVYAILEGRKGSRRDWTGVRCKAEGQILGSELVVSESSISSESGTQWTIAPAKIRGAL